MTSEEIKALREKVLALRCGAEDCVFGDDGRHGTVPCFCSGDMRDLDAGDEVLRAVPALLSAAEECERLRADRDEWRTQYENAIAYLDARTEASAAWESLYNERNRLWRAAEDSLERVRVLLAQNGCDCDCEHGAEDHGMSCDRCLACRVQGAIE